MKLKYTDEAMPKLSTYKRTMNLELLDEFLASGKKYAIVEGYHHINVYSCAKALNQSIKRFYPGTMKAHVRSGVIWLVKLD